MGLYLVSVRGWIVLLVAVLAMYHLNLLLFLVFLARDQGKEQCVQIRRFRLRKCGCPTVP